MSTPTPPARLSAVPACPLNLPPSLLTLHCRLEVPCQCEQWLLFIVCGRWQTTYSNTLDRAETAHTRATALAAEAAGIESEAARLHELSQQAYARGDYEQAHMLREQAMGLAHRAASIEAQVCLGACAKTQNACMPASRTSGAMISAI